MDWNFENDRKAFGTYNIAEKTCGRVVLSET